jgi:hypothetical protein
MRLRLTFLSFFLLPLFLSSCGGRAVVEEKTMVPAGKELDTTLNEEELVTHNVTYTGVLEAGGVTIYQQGTHRLMLSDGRMVLLETDKDADLALDLYVGKLVRVKGDVMPTVEAGGTIMKVSGIAWISREMNADGKEVEVERVLCGEGGGCPDGLTCTLSADRPGMCIAGGVSAGSGSGKGNKDSEVKKEEAGVVAGVVEGVEESEDSEETEESDDSKESEEENNGDAVVSHPQQNATIQLMLNEEYEDSRWTQEYCSQHVNFCIPVHTNWYFKSFGATTSLLWHVEMGAVNVENFGDGPLSVDLKSGDLAALGLTNGDVKTVGSRVIGYRTWSDNRHFEISADSSLKIPVAFVTKKLRNSE